MIVIHVLQSPDPSSKEPLLLIFMSSWGRDVLMASKTWVVDGTFKSCPHPFGQVFFLLFLLLLNLILYYYSIYRSISCTEGWTPGSLSPCAGPSCQGRARRCITSIGLLYTR